MLANIPTQISVSLIVNEIAPVGIFFFFLEPFFFLQSQHPFEDYKTKSQRRMVRLYIFLYAIWQIYNRKVER